MKNETLLDRHIDPHGELDQVIAWFVVGEALEGQAVPYTDGTKDRLRRRILEANIPEEWEGYIEKRGENVVITNYPKSAKILMEEVLKLMEGERE